MTPTETGSISMPRNGPPSWPRPASGRPATAPFARPCTIPGCRPAELIEIPPAWIDLSAGTVTIRSLKKRPDRNGAPKIVFRAVPVPAEYLDTLNTAFGIREAQRTKKRASVPIWPMTRQRVWQIDPDRWKREKPELLERAGLAEFADPEPVLATLRKALTQQYQRTNANAAANPHLKVRADGTFHIATPAAGADGPSPTNELFPQRHDVPLAQVLETINTHCGMLGGDVPAAVEKELRIGWRCFP